MFVKIHTLHPDIKVQSLIYNVEPAKLSGQRGMSMPGQSPKLSLSKAVWWQENMSLNYEFNTGFIISTSWSLFIIQFLNRTELKFNPNHCHCHHYRSHRPHLCPLWRWCWACTPDRSPCRRPTWSTACTSGYRASAGWSPTSPWPSAAASVAWWRSNCWFWSRLYKSENSRDVSYGHSDLRLR